MCPDKINDLICAPVAPQARLASILAFRDKHIRVYAGETMLGEHQLSGVPSSLAFYDKNEVESRPPGSQKECTVLYGTDSGEVGAVSIASGIEDAWT